MPVKVSCKCGQSFTAKDDLVGQTLLCPKCSQPLTIQAGDAPAAKSPQQGGIDSLFDEAGLKEVRGPRCPQCGAGTKRGAILCVNCGFNFETGDRVEAAKIRSAEDGSLEVAQMMMVQAAKQIKTDAAEERRSLKQGTPAWMLFLILVIVLGFSATMYFWPREQAVTYTGYEVIGLGILMSVVGYIRLLVISFFDSLVQGFLCLLIPLYVLIYVIMHWSKCQKFFLNIVGGGLVILFGLGLLALAPLFRVDQVRLPSTPFPGIVIAADSHSSDVQM